MYVIEFFINLVLYSWKSQIRMNKECSTWRVDLVFRRDQSYLQKRRNALLLIEHFLHRAERKKKRERVCGILIISICSLVFKLFWDTSIETWELINWTSYTHSSKCANMQHANNLLAYLMGVSIYRLLGFSQELDLDHQHLYMLSNSDAPSILWTNVFLKKNPL